MKRLISCLLASLALTFPAFANAPSEELKKAVAKNYADIVFASYEDSLKTAEDLRKAIGALVDQPSEQSLQTARMAWLESRPPYLQTEVYRFYGGPIDDPETGVEGLINAWPMDENYVDYVKGEEDAGVVNNPGKYPEITVELLEKLNEKDGEANISTGYHAIEFLLWGQDFSEKGPGERPYTDYVPGKGKNAERRAAYLRAATDLLVSHLQMLSDAWKPGGAYREKFLGMPTDEAIQKILQGMGMLSGFELSGERIAAAYETKAQEDEHSCFSDNTHVDHWMDAVGIQNVYLGRYKRIDGSTIEGPGIQDLVKAVDPALAGKLKKEIEASIEAIRAIPAPFDRAIEGEDDAPGRKKILAAVEALEAQSESMVIAAEKLGLKIDIEGEAES